MADDDGLVLRRTRFAGEVMTDDYQVIWRDLPIGRILRQGGVPHGQPQWWFGVDVYGLPQPPGNRGTGRDLKECQAKFKAVWTRVHAELSYDDIQRARRHLADVIARARE